MDVTMNIRRYNEDSLIKTNNLDIVANPVCF